MSTSFSKGHSVFNDMTVNGDIDIDGNLVLTTNCAIKETAINQMGIRNRADTTYYNFILNQLKCTQLMPTGSTLNIYTPLNAAHWISMQTWTGTWTEVLRLINGYIRVSNIPGADPGLGNNELWMDAAAGRVLKVGT